MQQHWSPTQSHPYTHSREGRASALACAIWVADARSSLLASPLLSVEQVLEGAAGGCSLFWWWQAGARNGGSHEGTQPRLRAPRAMTR